MDSSSLSLIILQILIAITVVLATITLTVTVILKTIAKLLPTKKNRSKRKKK